LKLHLATHATQNAFTAYGDGYVQVNDRKLTQSAIVTPEQIIEPWAILGFDALREEDFAPLVALSPEIVLLGSGAKFRFLHPAITRALSAARVGVEIMDTAAACRTYNVLLAEGRKVVAALIVESE
jgi:uncharacterized protein